ncbi:MAG: DUF2147 domain-containing protein [Bacteroidia bacterium]
MNYLLCIYFLITGSVCFAQQKAGDIIGKYMTPANDGILQITESNGKYYGKLVWIAHPENLDMKNPDKSLQTQKVLGLTILKDFIFDGDDTWEKGTIYDPKNGKTYSCKITRNEKGHLNVRGYIGISLLGRTEYFVRIEPKE